MYTEKRVSKLLYVARGTREWIKRISEAKWIKRISVD